MQLWFAQEIPHKYRGLACINGLETGFDSLFLNSPNVIPKSKQRLLHGLKKIITRELTKNRKRKSGFDLIHIVIIWVIYFIHSLWWRNTHIKCTSTSAISFSLSISLSLSLNCWIACAVCASVYASIFQVYRPSFGAGCKNFGANFTMRIAPAGAVNMMANTLTIKTMLANP